MLPISDREFSPFFNIIWTIWDSDRDFYGLMNKSAFKQRPFFLLLSIGNELIELHQLLLFFRLSRNNWICLWEFPRELLGALIDSALSHGRFWRQVDDTFLSIGCRRCGYWPGRFLSLSLYDDGNPAFQFPSSEKCGRYWCNPVDNLSSSLQFDNSFIWGAHITHSWMENNPLRLKK